MNDLGNVIKSLERLYGASHNYQALTDAQRDFLVQLRTDERDSIPRDTALILSIQAEKESPLVSLTEMFWYPNYRVSKTAFEYATERLPFYQRISSDASPQASPQNTERNTKGYSYLFTLKDSSLVKVTFNTGRDSGV